VPERCETCSSTAVARHGAGTERLEADLTALFAGSDFPVFRLDADTIAAGTPAGTPARAGGVPSAPAPTAQGEQDERSVGALLRRFQQAECGVLIGTQMVAKGHDFHDVSLGVVLDADSTLRFPDFRAEERTFALIAQLAGRVGRGGRGRVLVQSLAPDARAIEYAARHDSDGFIAGELDRRRALGYPPYSHLIRIVLAAEEARRALAAAQAVAGLLDVSFAGLAQSPGPQLLGPANLFRLRGRERQVLLVKAPERRPAVAAVGAAVAATAADRAHAGVSFSVDVDPQ
jgi:primosomal protein N' (replication factor Y)